MNNNQNKINRILIGALFLLLPILSVLHFPAKLAIVSCLFIGTLLYFYRFKGMKLVLKSSPIIVWFVLTMYHWINAMYQHVPEIDIIDLLHGLKIFSCICIFTFLGRADFDGTIKNLLICFSGYLLLSFVVNDMSSSELDGRMTGVMYSTALGQAAALTGFYVAYYSLRNRLNITKTALLYILPIVVILFTQSRNSLAMLVICLFGHVLAYAYINRINIVKTLAVLAFSGTVLFIALKVVIENTALGSRLADTEKAEQMNSNNDRLTGTILDQIAGDRLVYYVRGWEFFSDSPIIGIGMWNYRHQSQGLYPLHSEYMVHLTEGGLIGISLWLVFISLAFRCIKKSNQNSYIKVLAFTSMLSILFCGIYARIFFSEFFYPIIGLVLSMEYWKRPIEATRKKERLILSNFNNV